MVPVCIVVEEKAPSDGRLSLDAADLDCLWALLAVLDVERDLIALLKLVELYIDEIFVVEEEILLRTLALYEAEAAVRKTCDDSVLHVAGWIMHLITIKCRRLLPEARRYPHIPALRLIR